MVSLLGSNPCRIVSTIRTAQDSLVRKRCAGDGECTSPRL